MDASGGGGFTGIPEGESVKNGPIPIDAGLNMIHTSSMKIAISLPEDLCREVDLIAERTKTSRSRVFVVAVREQLKDLESKCLLDSINESYRTPDSSEDVKTRRAFQDRFFERAGKKDRFED